jgi:hypothetical protein
VHYLNFLGLKGRVPIGLTKTLSRQIVMNGLAPYIAVGLAAALAVTSLEFSLADSGSESSFSGSQAALISANSPAASATTSGKGDLLKPRPAGEQTQTVSMVELVGLLNAAVVLRDSGGHVLYRSDPMTGVTVVSKGVVVPQVTFREAYQASPRSAPAQSVQPSSVVPQGCKSGFSSGTEMSVPHIGLRCLTEREETVKVASLFD